MSHFIPNYNIVRFVGSISRKNFFADSFILILAILIKRMTLMNQFIYKVLIFCLLFASMLAEPLFAQRTIFRMHEYNKESSLPDELVKDIVGDQFGNQYLATDNGLFAFSYDEFHEILTPEWKSKYFKSFIELSDQTILVVADDAIYKIVQGGEYGKLEMFIDCNAESDQPQYPKNIYEDSKNRLWIADHTDLFCFSDGELVKFKMGKKNKSTSYQRSYQFMEMDNGQILAVSQTGWFYKFDENIKQFEEMNHKSEFIVHTLFLFKSNEFLLGTSKGLYNYKYSTEGGLVERKVLDQNIIASCIIPLSRNRFLVGTWFQGLIEVYLDPVFGYYPVGGFPTFTVNNLYRDRFGCIWAATNSGVVHMEKEFFSTQFIKGNSDLVKDLVRDKDKLYFLNGKDVYRIKDDFSIETYHSFENINSTGIGVWDDVLLLGNDKGEVSFYKNHKLVYRYKLSEASVTDIAVNSSREAWAVSDLELFRLDLWDGSVKSYLHQFDGKRLVHDVEYLDDHDLIICGNDENSYLFRYHHMNDTVGNISVKADFMTGKEFWTRDIEIDGDTIYVSSLIGLLKFYDSKVERVDMGTSTNTEITSVVKDQKGYLWVSGAKGVTRKAGDDLTLFTTEDGLPSKTSYVGNMLIDNKGVLWVGTANGLSYANISKKTMESPEAVIHRVQNNQHALLADLELEVDKNAMILLNVSSLFYPQSKNRFKYCIKSKAGMLEDWQSLSSKKQILISNLVIGNYELIIKSKHDGNYFWSQELVIPISVNQLWYLQWYSMLSLIIFLTGLVYLTVILSKKRARIRMLNLRRLVNEKTQDLNLVNLELKNANMAKDKFLSIIAHDLRNPFNAIRGFSQMLIEDGNVMDEDEKKDLIETIYRSSDDTYRLLENLLDWANVQKGRLEVSPTSFNMGKLMRDNLEIHKKLAALKKVSVEGEFPDLFVMADQRMTDTVIRNLISNAIKYSHPEQRIVLELEKNTRMAIVKITDQGVGMSPEKLEHLFHIDTIYSSNGTSDETGSGLGLMLCKEFIDLNGGAIRVDSEVNKGTVFSFTIPLDK